MTTDKKCQYFKDDKGIGGDCYEEQNGKAKFREEFGVFFCDHHYRKLSEVVNEVETL
tara:strand:- start:170 stop:340 length:171 start_codon:yes stop_codon:yes gene_type:complete